MTVRLMLMEKPDIPIEAEVIRPDAFAGRTITEIEQLPVYQGNRTYPLSEFFEVRGRAGAHLTDTAIEIEGDLRNVKMIGRGMTGGRIVIHGDVGMYLGAEMRGGRIRVIGSVGSWAAAEMRGGNIQIEGNAGDYLCAGLRGSIEGMRGGRVYVAGDAGREMASHMRKGFIAVRGNVGELAAARMQGGTIIVCGGMGHRAGVEAVRGMMIVLGRLGSVLPTFRYSGTAEREFVGYYLRYLTSRRPDFLELPNPSAKWIKLQGDFAEDHPYAEIYAWAADNEHLVTMED